MMKVPRFGRDTKCIESVFQWHMHYPHENVNNDSSSSWDTWCEALFAGMVYLSGKSGVNLKRQGMIVVHYNHFL